MTYMMSVEGLLCLFLLFVVTPAKGNLNLFLTEQEVKKLFGPAAELYYVRNGVVNKFAMGFTVPVPADFDALEFVWQNLHHDPPKQMPYSIQITYGNRDALDKPRLSIRPDGVVPNKKTAFDIILPCTGSVSAVVDVNIQMRIGIFSATNLTTLDFKRTKTCLKDKTILHVSEAPATTSAPSSPSSLSRPTSGTGNAAQRREEEDDEEGEETTSTFYIAVGCAAALMGIIAISVAVYCVRTRKTNGADLVSDGSSVYQPTSAPTHNNNHAGGGPHYTPTAHTNHITNMNHHQHTNGHPANISLINAHHHQQQHHNHRPSPPAPFNRGVQHHTPHNLSQRSGDSSSNSFHRQYSPVPQVLMVAPPPSDTSSLHYPHPSHLSHPSQLPHINSLHSYNPSLSADTSLDSYPSVENKLKVIHVERKSISFGQLILEGTFGRVYRGTLTTSPQSTQPILILYLNIPTWWKFTSSIISSHSQPAHTVWM